VKENRPHLSAGSIKTYKSILKNIYDKCYDDKEYEFKKFDDDSVILNHLKDIAFNKRKTVLAGLSVLTGNPAYQKVMMHDIHEYNAEQLKQVKTPAQEEGMIEPEEVMAIFNQLETNAKHCLKKQTITPSDLVEIQKWVMLALTGGIFQPPRRSVDFGMMKWRNYDKEKDNYIDIKNSKFIYQNYKTAKIYGEVAMEIPKPLKVILNKWFKVVPDGCDYVLFDAKMKGLTSPQMTHRLNDVFGKKISTSMLRHIFLQKKFGNVDLEELQKTATAMGNSSMQALLYTKK
jgi:integrase